MQSSAIHFPNRPAHRALAGMVAIAAFSLLAILTAPASAQLSQARISGTVVDEEGQPVGNLVLQFLPQGEAGKLSKSLKVKKNGKFSHSFFPTGYFTIELESDELFLKSMEYVLRTDANQEYVARLEKYVNDKLEEVQPDGRRLSVRSALALAALSIADDYFSASDDRDELDQSVKRRLKKVLARVDAALTSEEGGADGA